QRSCCVPRAFVYTAIAITDTSTLSLHDALPISNLATRKLVVLVQIHPWSYLTSCSKANSVPGSRQTATPGSPSAAKPRVEVLGKDRKSTRLNSSHEWISYAVFCLIKITAESTIQ